MPRKKIVSVVWRLWYTDTMQTETYFEDSIIKHVTDVYDSIIARSGDIPEASVETDSFYPVGQEKSSQKINKRLKYYNV